MQASQNLGEAHRYPDWSQLGSLSSSQIGPISFWHSVFGFQNLGFSFGFFLFSIFFFCFVWWPQMTLGLLLAFPYDRLFSARRVFSVPVATAPKNLRQ